MDLKKVLDFLLDLQFNNDRNWFKENEQRYRESKKIHEDFIDGIIPKIKVLDKSIDVESSKECVFRIYRDVRFSKDNLPYKTNFGAYIAPGGKKSPLSGYYIHIQNDNSFIGGGIYSPEPATLKKIRTGIFENIEEYKQIINNKKFTAIFPEIYGDKLKMAPKGFSKDFADIELLKPKHYAVTHAIDNDFWLQENVDEKILEVFKIQYDFNQFLNRAVLKS